MDITKIKHLSQIINDNHGQESLFVLFDNLIKYNPDLTYSEIKSYFIELLRYMMSNNMIKLAGVYTDRENIWEGSIDEILNRLEKWYPKENEWNYKADNSIKFYYFDYPFIKWIKAYPIKIE